MFKKQRLLATWHCCIILRLMVFELGSPIVKKIPTVRKTHADMQTQPERGNKKFGFMSPQ